MSMPLKSEAVQCVGKQSRTSCTPSIDTSGVSGIAGKYISTILVNKSECSPFNPDLISGSVADRRFSRISFAPDESRL